MTVATLPISKWSRKMPFTFKLVNGDLSIKSGRLQTITGADEVKQRVLVAYQHYWEEYFLNVPDGVPWYEIILGSKDKKTAELILRRQGLEVPGVVGIISFDIDFNNTTRLLSISAVFEVLDIDENIVLVPINLFAQEPYVPDESFSG